MCKHQLAFRRSGGPSGHSPPCRPAPPANLAVRNAETPQAGRAERRLWRHPSAFLREGRGTTSCAERGALEGRRGIVLLRGVGAADRSEVAVSPHIHAGRLAARAGHVSWRRLPLGAAVLGAVGAVDLSWKAATLAS